ncbi:MAG: NADH-quinone oxidoreductase subunit H [Candidatus Methanomethylophilaceae archaeon]|nr:NADH-quinone oxidoreductase subunit H [Candidatus Methanomethylophilaceae archaeon]
MIWQEIVIELVQAAVLIAIAPLMSGIVSKFKALMQKRVGASIFQPYRDLAKLFRKDSVKSRSCSWVFRAVPYVCMASMVVLAMMTPFVYTGVLAPFGDLVAVVYLFTMFRFAMVLGGLEGGSTFGGMGSSREMMMSVLIEPALLLAIATLAVISGAGTDMGGISANIAEMGLAALTPALILAGASFMITLLAENARIPFDNPTTHLELTMVHEAMMLEYSGRGLAMMELSSMMRLTIFMAMVGSLFFPWGIASDITVVSLGTSVIVMAVKMVLVAFVLSLVESALCKTRLFKTPNLLTASFTLSLLAMISLYIL